MDGLISAWAFDGNGSGYSLEDQPPESWFDRQDVVWLHFDYEDTVAREWLANQQLLDPIAYQALVSEETRPRVLIHQDFLLLTLRGVNLNPDSEPDDMVSIRMWVTPRFIISTRRRRLLSEQDIVEALKVGRGPSNSADFIIMLAQRLAWRMDDIVDRLDEQVTDIEADLVERIKTERTLDLRQLRRQGIVLRRFFSPQREALSRLSNEVVNWITEAQRLALRETTDQMIRLVENIDMIRERTTVIQEEIIARQSDQLNKKMYVLSIVTTVFLPLGFFTGLFGANLAGMPGTEWQGGFWALVVALGLVTVVELYLFRIYKWF